MTHDEILERIRAERKRQNELHPTFPPFKHDRFAILAEEFGEIAKAINENEEEEMVDEILHTLSVCWRWLETIPIQIEEKEKKKEKEMDLDEWVVEYANEFMTEKIKRKEKFTKYDLIEELLNEIFELLDEEL